MMYNNKLAIAIKANGRVLREFGDKVYVPFGTEYSILIKNLHTTKALININIDGNKAVEGGLIVEGGKEIELERFFKKDLNKGNKFKFIERTASVEQHKGIGLEDGLISVTYQFEQAVQHIVYPSSWIVTSTYPCHPYPHSYEVTCDTSSTQTYSSTNTISTNETYRAPIRARSTNHAGNNTKGILSSDRPTLAENGITVPGNISEQKFVTGYIGPLEPQSYSMVIKLLGEGDDKKPISKPVTVNIKPTCVTCGKINKATSKFCSNCGTSLQIVA